jgi:predicted DNA-binding protein (UPF0251 family)
VTDIEPRELTENEARELTASIYGHLDSAWTKIKEAYYGRADKALGYDSWDDYCKGEFHGAYLRLPRESRREVVATLTEAGLSQRVIAAAVGVSKNTVIRDQSKSHLGPVADAPGLDGKIHPNKAVGAPEPTIVIDGTFVESIPEPIKDSRPDVVRLADQAASQLREAAEKISIVRADKTYAAHEALIKELLDTAVAHAEVVLKEYGQAW